MNLLWGDDFGSLFSASASDASGGPALSPDTGTLSGQSLLWTGNGSSPSAAWDTGQDTLWADPGHGTATWPLADNTSDTGATGLGNGSLPFNAGSLPSDIGSLVWQTTLFAFEELSATVNSSTLDSTLNQVLDVLWTDTGGSGSPPVTLPHAPTNPFVDGFPPFSLPPTQLVWTGQPHGSIPDGTGQTPLAPPVTGNTPLTGDVHGATFSTLAPQQLVWTDPSQGVPTTLTDLANTGATPLNTLFGRT